MAKELLEPWLKGRGVPEPVAKEMAEEIAKEAQIKEEAEKVEKSWTTFKKNGTGIFLEERQIKACLKEAAFVLRLTKKRGLRETINHGLFTEPDKIYLTKGTIGDTGEVMYVTERDGYIEQPIHVMGPRGPRNALKRQDYVEKAEAEFTIVVAGPEPPTITEKNIRDMLELGQRIGLGASRSQGYGKFDIVELTPLQPKAKKKTSQRD